MLPIIIEGVLFVALIAASAALLYFGILHFTPVGTRILQAQNRERIERAALLACPIHGPRAEEELVRLPNGSRVCPECYQETFHG